MNDVKVLNTHFWELCSQVTVQWGRRLQGGCSGQLLQHGYLVPFEVPHGAPCYAFSSAGIPGSCATSALGVSHTSLNLPSDGTNPSGSLGSPRYWCCIEQPLKMTRHQCIVCRICSHGNKSGELLAELKKAGSNPSMPSALDVPYLTLLWLSSALGVEPLYSASLQHETILLSAREALNLPLPLTLAEITEKHHLEWKQHTRLLSCSL